MSASPARLRVCLVNGSLRGPRASSLRFLERVERHLDPAAVEIARMAVRARVPHGHPEQTLAALDRADAVVLAFPLYAYCLPGGFIRLLEDWAGYAKSHPSRQRPRVHAIVNCAFVQPEINAEAIRVVEHFCERLGLRWRFAVAIACGPAVLATAPIDRVLRRAMKGIARDIQSGDSGPKEDILIKPILPRIIMDTVREHLDRKCLAEAMTEARRAAPSEGNGAGDSWKHLPLIVRLLVKYSNLRSAFDDPTAQEGLPVRSSADYTGPPRD